MGRLVKLVVIAVLFCFSGAYAQGDWQLQIVGASITPGQAQAVANSGMYAYIADADHGVSVFDLSNPALPLSSGSYSNGGIISDLLIDGDNAYLAHWGRGLVVLDISNPAMPESIAAYNTPGSVIDIDKQDSYIYAADFFNGLLILDITDFNDISQAGYTSQMGIISVAAMDSTVYTGIQSMGLMTYSFAGATDPVSRDLDAISTDCNDIVIYENFLLLACGQVGMLVYDITDPFDPDSVTAINTSGSLNRIAVKDTIAYLADSENGLVAVSVNDPRSPYIIQTLDTPGIASGVGFYDDFVLVADRGMLLVVYHDEYSDIDDDYVKLPSSLSLNDCYPNPFNPSTNISFDLNAPASITLDIYDIQGRMVERLLEGYYGAGTYSIEWNAGEKPTGMYFIRLSGGGYTSSMKALYLK